MCESLTSDQNNGEIGQIFNKFLPQTYMAFLFKNIGVLSHKLGKVWLSQDHL